MRSSSRVVAGSLLFAFLVACSGAPVGPAPDLAGEESVNPGINDGYLKEGAAERFEGRFETESREIFARRGEIVAALRLRPGLRVADVGTGTGVYLKPFADAVGDAGHVYAVDISPGMVAFVADRVRRLRLQNVTVVQCTERSTELPEDSVDLVFVCDTYHHFEYPYNTLDSIYRALRPGGQLLLIDFHRIEGKSRPWLLRHVRAGEEVFTREVEESGFELVERRDDLLEENYFLRFRRVER